MLRVGTVTVLVGVNALSCCRSEVYSPPLLPHQVFSWLLVARLHALPKRPSGKIHTNAAVVSRGALSEFSFNSTRLNSRTKQSQEEFDGPNSRHALSVVRFVIFLYGTLFT